MEKWPVFDQNHGLSPVEKSQFFDLLNFFFYLFSKKKMWKNGHFWTKTMGYKPLRKNLNFSTFWISLFIAQNGLLSLQNKVKYIFLAYFASILKLEKWPFFWAKPWVNPFGKISVFRLFEFLAFKAQKGVLSL